MPDLNAVLDSLVEWAQETIPQLEGSYDHEPATKDQPLPDVIARPLRVRESPVGERDEDFPELTQLQQRSYRKIEAELLLMVAPKPEATAAATLNGFVDALSDAIRSDRTLGNRVIASRRFEGDFRRPFLTFDDKTTGRGVLFQMTVAEET